MRKKTAMIAVAAGLALGAAAFGLAGASFTGGGSGSGSGSTGFPTTFTVSSPIFVGGPLYPGTGADTIYATIQNATGASLALNQLEVSIAGVTMNPPGSLYATDGDPACTAADYALSAPTSGPGSFWTGLTVNGSTKTGQSATWTQNLPQNIGVDDYVDHGLPGGPGVVEGLPGGLTLIMLDTTANQDACQGASVQVTVSANGPGSPVGGTGAASFVVTKSATPSGVYAGSSTPITYTLTASNNGGGPGGVTISDTAPTGTTLVSGSNSCPTVTPPAACSTWVSGSSAYWAMTNVGPGASVAVTFQVTANSGDATGVISNTALWSGPGCTAAVTCPTNTTTTTVTAPTPLLITASPTTSTYGGAAPTVTPVYTPPIGAPLMSPPTCSSTITASTVVGTYTGANTCSGASDPAYSITYLPGTGDVDPAPLTVTASGGSLTYGGTVPAITCGITGYVNGQNQSALTTTPAGSTTATGSSPAGSYASTCAGGAAANYAFTYLPGKVTVEKAALTITASSGSFTQGGTPPTITAGYSGFQNGDSASSLTTPPRCTTTATSSSPVGTYPTSCYGAVDQNYTFTYVPGSVTLTAGPVTSPATVTPVTAVAATTPLATPASTAPAIAFTGALLSEEWLIGLALLLLGAALMVIARWRRRTPAHAAK